jgi:hypothetical protein
MIDELKEQEDVHGICGLRTCRDRAALIFLPFRFARGQSVRCAPLRLVTPLKYGIKQFKQIGRIFYTDARPQYWHEQGYDYYAGL